MLLVGVAVLTFASLVYFAEKDTLEGFSGGGWTFLDSFWWGIMTPTTVGYDHKSPQTFMGKVYRQNQNVTTQTFIHSQSALSRRSVPYQ